MLLLLLLLPAWGRDKIVKQEPKKALPKMCRGGIVSMESSGVCVGRGTNLVVAEAAKIARAGAVDFPFCLPHAHALAPHPTPPHPSPRRAQHLARHWRPNALLFSACRGVSCLFVLHSSTTNCGTQRTPPPALALRCAASGRGRQGAGVRRGGRRAAPSAGVRLLPSLGQRPRPRPRPPSLPSSLRFSRRAC